MNKPNLDDLEATRTIVGALGGFDARDQERILRWAREKLGLATAVNEPPLQGRVVPAALAQTPTQSPTPALDIRSFMAKKSPSSDTQFAAAVAYYYRFEAPTHLRKESITAGDLREACRQVDRIRIKHLAQTLVNAHYQGLLDRGERGAYIINTVGENLVAMALPADGTVRSPVRIKSRLGVTKRAPKKTRRAGTKAIKARQA